VTWTAADAERYLASLEPIGWRLGLERIRRLVSVLGMPQHRFASIHVVGTNGKSSVAQMIVALLEAHGVRTGAYLSPHVERWSERVRIGGAEIAPDAFAAAVQRVAESVEAVNRALDEGESVTQFEVATAAAFVALADAGVEVGVIEAGLGGRLDATNVLPSRVTALTSVGLDHTDWLGETVEEIASEKLAVLQAHSTLVVGALDARSMELARRTAEERTAALVKAAEAPAELPLGAPYLRRNFGVAIAAGKALVGSLDPARVRAASLRLELGGRMELHHGDPPLISDAAHNPAGAAALAEALAEQARGRPVVACLAMLDDKDAAGFVAALAPVLAAAVCTEVPANRLQGAGRPGARSLEPGRLAGVTRAAGVVEVEAITVPERALERTRELARERQGVALVAGTHYLLPYA
jgi:dihydrofolate synthase / folylpolyglutamate synthase